MSATEFTNTTKVPDRARPIHRINSPSFDENRPPASGRGHDCGCRGPEDFLGEAHPEQLLNAMRTIPDWVPVEREGKPPHITREAWRTLPEIEYEVEGVLSESRQAGSDVPFAQWHLWYDWNFFVIPAKGFEYLRGRGNPHEFMECEWDCGAFGDYDFQSSLPTPAVPGPMFGRDWAWPGGGGYIWLAGRWIYDCGHPQSRIILNDGSELFGDITKEVSKDVVTVREGEFAQHSTVVSTTIATKDGPVTVTNADVREIQKQQFVHSEIHPCKAVAAARWEAVKFDDNERPVPAIQFMFFACFDGGYISPFPLNDRDYEFIVDLPESVEDKEPYPIGHTPDFPLNTLVLRPRLLVKFDYTPFANARGPVAQSGQADPLIEILPAEKGGVPQQVKLRVPLTTLGSSTHSYGVIASLGWHDPERKQAEKVKLVNVFLDSLEIGEAFPYAQEHEGTEPWQMKIGVNGRWFAKTSTVSRQGMKIPLGLAIELYLAEDDEIAITTYGIRARFNADLFARPLDQRTLRRPSNIPVGVVDDDRGPTPGSHVVFRPGDALVWGEDIDQPDEDRASDVAADLIELGFSTLIFERELLNEENEGRQQIKPGRPIASRDSPNPLTLKELMSRMSAPGRPMRGKLTAARITDTGIAAPDYILHYEVKYEDLDN